MLCQRAVECMDEALEAMADRAYERKNDLLVRAQDIALELADALDLEQGGDMATNLQRLYFYIYQQLVRANTRMDQEAVLRARKVMADLGHTWKRVVLGDDSIRPRLMGHGRF